MREGNQIAERIRKDVLAALPAEDRKVFLDSLTLLVSDRLAEPVECQQSVRRRAPRV